MTVFAACAIAGAAVAVDSNIVGYTTKGVAANQKVISGAQFVEVGEAGLDIKSIKLEGVSAIGNAFIQWWNGTGYDRATWAEIDFEPTDIGWCDENTWEAVTYTFAAGEGFWIIMPNVANAKVTQAGEVALSESVSYDFALEANKKFIVINPLPTDLSLLDIKLTGVSPIGNVFIQWWNGTGYDRATWAEIDFEPTDIGWCDENTWEAVSYTFSPNEGFWILVPSSGVTIPEVKITNTVL